MNPTFMWIENLMMLLAGITVIPVLIGAASHGTRLFSVTGIPVLCNGYARMKLRRQRETFEGRIGLKCCRWRRTEASIALYQSVVRICPWKC